MKKILLASDGVLWLGPDEYVELIRVGDMVNDSHLIQKFGRKTYDNRMLRYIACLANEAAGYYKGMGSETKKD